MDARLSIRFRCLLGGLPRYSGSVLPARAVQLVAAAASQAHANLYQAKTGSEL